MLSLFLYAFQSLHIFVLLYLNLHPYLLSGRENEEPTYMFIVLKRINLFNQCIYIYIYIFKKKETTYFRKKKTYY